MKERTDFRVYSWNDMLGRWEYMQTIQAYSTKQARGYAKHALPNFGRMVTAFPVTDDPIADFKLAMPTPMRQ